MASLYPADHGALRADASGSDSLEQRYIVRALHGRPGHADIGVITCRQFTQGFTSQNQFVTLSENHIFSTSLLNTARFSFSRTNL